MHFCTCGGTLEKRIQQRENVHIKSKECSTKPPFKHANLFYLCSAIVVHGYLVFFTWSSTFSSFHVRVPSPGRKVCSLIFSRENITPPRAIPMRYLKRENSFCVQSDDFNLIGLHSSLKSLGMRSGLLCAHAHEYLDVHLSGYKLSNAKWHCSLSSIDIFSNNQYM